MQCLPQVNPWAFSKADGVSCDDDDKCTKNDRCNDGICRGEDAGCLTLARTGRAHADCEVCSTRSPTGCGVKPGFRGCVVQEDAAAGTPRSCGCLIGQQCYRHGASNPDNQCEVCDVSRDASAWSNNDGGRCDAGDRCVTNAQCVAGTCQGSRYTCPTGACVASSECDGTGGCNTTFLSPDTVCRPGIDACKPEVRCTGTTAACPRSIDLVP